MTGSALAATQVSCSPYLNNKSNYLFNLGIVGGSSTDPNNKNSDELVPDREVKNNGYWAQYYYLDKHRNYPKILLECIYNNGESVVKLIPKDVNICVKKYTTEKLKANQSSIISFNCDFQ